jgi:hypothetical protein
VSELDRTFVASLQKSPNRGGWTFVQMAGSAEYFGTRSGQGQGYRSMAIRSPARSWLWATARTSCR